MSTPAALPSWAPAGTRYAGFWIRVGANALDLLWLGAIHMAVRLATGAGLPASVQVTSGPASLGIGSVTMGAEAGPVDLFGAVFPPLAILGFWIALGATPGKMACRLRIVDEVTGRRPTAWQCIGRYVMALLAVAAAGIGYAWIAIDPRRQGWHDKIVRTLVLRRS